MDENTKLNPALVVFLNGKYIRHCVSFSTEEGWVEILDLNKMTGTLSIKDTDEPLNFDIPTPIETYTKKLYGKVEVKKIE